MPPLPFVPGVAKMICEGHLDDADFVNIFHMQYLGSPPTPTQLDDFIGMVEASLERIYIHNGLPALSLDSVTMIDLSSDIGATTTQLLGTAGTLSTGDVLPASAAVCCSQSISRRYRGGHPRTYFMLGSSATLEGSSMKDWQASFLTNVGTDFGDFVSDSAGTAGGVTWSGACNVSYVTGGARRPTAVVDHITGVVAHPRICSQRRRLGKVGG